MDDEIVVGWENIHRKLYSHMSFEALKKLAPELRAAGVVGIEVIGRPPNRKRVAWCYQSHFKAYMLLKNQKREKKKYKS